MVIPRSAQKLISNRSCIHEKERNDQKPSNICVPHKEKGTNAISTTDYLLLARDEQAKCRIVFKNNTNSTFQDVTVLCVLTDNLEITDNVSLINAKHQYGTKIEGKIKNTGVNIGTYAPGESAELDFNLRAINSEDAGEESVTVNIFADGMTWTQNVSVEVMNSNGGWGDNTNGRRDYTIDQINSGELGNLITFNSIIDGKIGREFNFVGARAIDDSGLWNADSIDIEDGGIYVIRAFVHNNSPLGYDAVAEDVKITFSLPVEFAKEQTVVGYIDSSNAVPSRYWDGVTLKSDQYFFIEYIEDSALLENNEIGKGGITLPNEIITEGTFIGYDALNGGIPGCYEYSGVVTIKVQVHMKK